MYLCAYAGETLDGFYSNPKQFIVLDVQYT